MKPFYAILFICLLYPAILFSQELSNLRTKKIILENDTVKIDSFSVVVGSLMLFSSDSTLLDSSSYFVNYIEPYIITDEDFRKTHKEIFIKYRVFNFNFKEVIKNKNLDSLKIHSLSLNDGYYYKPLPAKQDLFGIGNLTSDGSISRGISVGNNQDAVVNSSLNLQLSGKLSNDLNIVAAITDNNMPVQPEGTTQQIQEFDKVYIQIYNNIIKLTAGDFEICNPNSHFMRFNKKAQGGLFDLNYDLNEKENKIHLNSSIAAAISKGRYAKNSIPAVEGNQGPYKLRGANNELYIIVLAGTEKVYIDGRLLLRGQDFDYIMDYNTAEITFMPRNLITKDKRIIVEFEYSDKNYARSMFFSGNKIKSEKMELQFNFFSEQDIKSQPQNQELTSEQKLLLSTIGDSLQNAISYNIDSMPFSDEYVMYKMLDSLVNGTLYDSVFVYSINPDSAHYRLGFTNTGPGNGNYIQQQTAANGRVYKWVAPLNGIKQGTYQPVILLIAPQKQQMFTFNAGYYINKNTNANLELSVSNNDLNTFSKLNNNDNSGIAIKVGVENIKKIKSTDTLNLWQLKTSCSHEWTQKYFKPIERYRDAEFERFWNITDQTVGDEHLSGLKVSLFDNKKNSISYGINSFLKSTAYQGLQNSFNANLYKGKYFSIINAYLTNSKTSFYRTTYVRQNTIVGRNFKWFTLGIKNEYEKNQFHEIITDTLTTKSTNFEQYEAFINNADTSSKIFTLFYRIRNDFHPNAYKFNLSSRADEAGASAAFGNASKQKVSFFAAYRSLYNLSDFLLLQGIKPDNNIIGRVEYFCRAFKGLISLNTFYEIGSGLEVKNEYVFVEVPPGQGAYTWTDYNNNTVKELDEFQVAAFQDQANYIKVFVPTNEYIKAYSNQYNQIINVSPASIWNEKKGVKKFVSRFSEQMFFQLSKKTTENNWMVLNPIFFQIADSNLLSINSSIKNILSFNSYSPVFGMDYNFNDNRSKMLLVNGFDSREMTLNSLKIRLNIVRKIFFNATASVSNKSYNSQFFSNRNYKLNIQELEPVVSYQPNTNFRISLIFKYTEKENQLPLIKEKADFKQVGTEFRYSKLEKGNIMAKINYIIIKYNAPTSTPLAYEILDALQPGNNLTWNILYQKNLKNNMQLSLIYDGRKPGENKMVHFGSVQIRAYF